MSENRYMKRALLISIFAGLIFSLGGCSQDSAEKIRYDMEKLIYQANKTAEKVNIQPELSFAADSLAMMAGYQKVLDYYYDKRNHPSLTDQDEIVNGINSMAYVAQKALAIIYAKQRKFDSVFTAYDRLINDINTSKDQHTAASLELAIIYRSMGVLDSTVAIYDRILVDFYPPIDSGQRLNLDVASIPIDKLKLANAMKDADRLSEYAQLAIEYYDGLLDQFSDNFFITRTALVNKGRIYAMTERWDESIATLKQIEDTTGQLEIPSAMLIANIYYSAKKQPDEAIKMYRSIIAREPDSTIIGEAMLRLGGALCFSKKYQEGREVLSKLREKFPYRTDYCARSQMYTAKAFEAEGNWKRALSEMEWLMEKYPYTEESFRTAREIPLHYLAEKDEKMAGIWFEKANDFYQNAINSRSEVSIQVAALLAMAELKRELGEFEEAMSLLNRVVQIAPKSNIAARALYNSAALAYVNLGDSTLAQTYLDQLNRDYGTVDSAQIEAEESGINFESLQ